MPSNKRHPKKITATQRQQLERLYDSSTGAMPVSNRNTKHYMHNCTAVGLVKLGLVKWRYGHDTVRITEEGRQRVQDWRTLAAPVKR